MSTVETYRHKNYDQERNSEIEKTGHEQLDRMRHDLEPDPTESHTDHQEKLEDLRQSALEKAAASEEATVVSNREDSPYERHGPITKKQLDVQFDKTMIHIREELSASSRTFSKIIHNKAIERTSDVIGSTIARPNALLFGAICAFTITLGLYLFAKNMGYTLSGFEPIGAFTIGWLFGLLYDYFKVMITGKK